MTRTEATREVSMLPRMRHNVPVVSPTCMPHPFVIAVHVGRIGMPRGIAEIALFPAVSLMPGALVATYRSRVPLVRRRSRPMRRNVAAVKAVAFTTALPSPVFLPMLRNERRRGKYQ